jgi:ABC-2 type transport system ATP-binding protein
MMQTALETRNLCVSFPSKSGKVQALDNLNLKVKTGQVFGFLGPNGAGKTTAMHILLGFIPATSGEALIFDTDVRHSIARNRIGYLPEHPDTYRFLTGREMLTFAGRLFLLKGNELLSRVESVLNMTDMNDAADRRIATYSRGMMQRICPAQALINNPDLLILDEPTGGLDPMGRMAIRTIISDLKAEGKTIFFSSHELSEVELVCDHIAILVNGKTVTEGAASDLVASDESLERYFMKTVQSIEHPNTGVGS